MFRPNKPKSGVYCLPKPIAVGDFQKWSVRLIRNHFHWGFLCSASVQCNQTAPLVAFCFSRKNFLRTSRTCQGDLTLAQAWNFKYSASMGSVWLFVEHMFLLIQICWNGFAGCCCWCCRRRRRHRCCCHRRRCCCHRRRCCWWWCFRLYLFGGLGGLLGGLWFRGNTGFCTSRNSLKLGFWEKNAPDCMEIGEADPTMQKSGFNVVLACVPSFDGCHAERNVVETCSLVYEIWCITCRMHI